MTDHTADLLALRYLVERYAKGCDTRDAALLATVFADGATVTVHWTDRPPSTMRMPEHLDRIPTGLGRYERTMHFVGNHRAEVDGDEAVGETYCLAHHVLDGNDHVMAIRYQDAYRRTADGWRLVSRELLVDWTQDLPVNR